MTELVLEDLTLKVRDIQVKFEAFETQNSQVGHDDEQSMEDNEALTVQSDEPQQLTLEEVYNMYQSQPQTEEEWEKMNKAIKAAVAYENSLPNGTKIRLAKTDWTSGSPQ